MTRGQGLKPRLSSSTLPRKLVLNGQAAAADGEEEGDSVRPRPRKAAAAASASVELFSLALDPYEKKNLAAEQPKQVEELRARLDQFAKAVVPPKAAPAAKDFKAPKVWGEKD